MTTGYLYPEFPADPGFVRDDAATVGRNIERLSAGWLDAVYGGEYDVLGHIKADRARYRIQPWSPTVSSYRWAIAKHLGERGRTVMKALEAMLADGTVDRILAKYR